jgi:natural product precursor
MKRLKKINLNEAKIVSRLSNGVMKHLLGGYGDLAGCSCGHTQSACTTCQC